MAESEQEKILCSKFISHSINKAVFCHADIKVVKQRDHKKIKAVKIINYGQFAKIVQGSTQRIFISIYINIDA